MSVESMALVLHHSRAAGTAKLVLLGIANHDGDGGAWPTVSTLARYANVTERAVQQAIGKLINLGELHVHRQQGGTRDLHDWERPNRYDVVVSCPIGCDRSKNHRVKSYAQDTPLEGVKQASPGEAGVTGGGEAGFTQTVHRTTREPSTCVTQDRASTVPVDNDRPPAPANPPADELAKVREKLRASTEATKRQART